MISLIANFTIKDGTQAEFEAAMKTMAEAVLANEPGVTLYQLNKKKGSQTEYFMMELYDTAETLAAHGKTDHMKAAGAVLTACFAAAPEIIMAETVN